MAGSHRIGRSRIARQASLWLAVLLCAAAGPAHAAQWVVESGGANVAFSPQFLAIQAGDTVTFRNLGGYHNVVADDGSFRCAHGCSGDGSGGNGNASSDLWIATVAFATPGKVGYFCEPHGAPGSGMYGTITVLAPAPPPQPAPVGGAWLAALAAIVSAAAILELARRSHRGVQGGRG